MSDIDPGRPSVDFEPVVLRPPGRRRRPEPALMGAVIVTVALAVAVVKPWHTAPSGTTARPTHGPTAATAAAAPALDPADPPTAVRVLAALAPHDAWGVRVVAPASGGSVSLAETWQPAVPIDDDRISALAVTSTPGIVAIGVTAPADDSALDVRAWARGHDGQWHRLDVGRFASDRPAADLLLPPPTVDGAVLPAWPSGRYRLDLLTGDSIRRIDLTIDPDVAPAEAPISTVPSLDREGPIAWLGAVPSGPFAVADGVVQPLAGVAGDAITDAEAWLGDERVATAWLPSATGLGVLLPAGTRDPSGVIRRLAPDPIFAGPVGRAGVRFGAANARTPYVVFDAPEASRFEPGLYAMDIQWSGTEGRRARTWTMELRPGPVLRSTSLLAAARRYAGQGGIPGLILQGAGRRQTDPAAAPVRTFAITPSIGCGDALIDETPAVIGFGHAVDDYLGTITVTLHGANGRELDVPLRVARSVRPGLTLVAPVRGVAFSAGIYRFHIDDWPADQAFTVCLGTSPFSG
jgi:hypothetical protein